MEDKKLWRYYDLIKFLTIINGDLYFARGDKFKDKYEGAIPKQNFQEFVEWMGYGVDKSEIEEVRKEFLKKFEEKKKKAAISCWHVSQIESAAMWEIYSKAGQGIAISTTYSKLAKIKKPVGYELEMFKVDYIDFENEFSDDYFFSELLPFKNKRKEFSHEQEFRMMLYRENPNSKPFDGVRLESFKPIKSSEVVKHGFVSKLEDIPQEGIKVKVDPSELIDEIIASPYMENFEINEIQRLLNMINKERNTNFTIKRSYLYDAIQY